MFLYVFIFFYMVDIWQISIFFYTKIDFQIVFSFFFFLFYSFFFFYSFFLHIFFLKWTGLVPFFFFYIIILFIILFVYYLGQHSHKYNNKNRLDFFFNNFLVAMYTYFISLFLILILLFFYIFLHIHNFFSFICIFLFSIFSLCNNSLAFINYIQITSFFYFYFCFI